MQQQPIRVQSSISTGGAPGAPGFLGSVDRMWKMNGQSAALAAHLAGGSWSLGVDGGGQGWRCIIRSVHLCSHCSFRQRFPPTHTNPPHTTGALLLPSSTKQQAPPRPLPPLAVLTGASAALDPRACTGMLGYGMSKAATHFLVQSLAAQFEEEAGRGSTVLAVLPTTLDTPANRAAMPGADFAGWTKVYAMLCVHACVLYLW